jgi:hypothetical protein
LIPKLSICCWSETRRYWNDFNSPKPPAAICDGGMERI